MIRNEKEYQEAVRRLEQDINIIHKQEDSLKEHGLTPEEIARALEPMLSFHQQLVEEVEWYERVKREDFDVISSLTEIGRSLIALRIASDLTQRELAERLGVSEAQVSRDERNEYHGISLERAQRIISVLGAHLRAQLEFDPPSQREKVPA